MNAYHSRESTRDTKAEAYTFISASDIAESLGFTPLHVAVLQNSPEEVEQYLQIDLSHLNAQDNLGRTPLILDSSHSNEQATRILLRCGADPNIKDRSKRAPLHYAAQRSLGIVQALVESSEGEGEGDRMASLLETRDARGRSPPCFAIEFNRWEVLDYLCKRGVSLDIKDGLHRTLLHYAAWTGQAEAMDVLSRQDLSGIDPAALDSLGQTAEECFNHLRKDVRATTAEAFQRLLATAGRG